MSIMTTSQFKSVVDPVLNEIFDGLYERRPKEWTKLFEVKKALPRRFQEDVVLAGLSVAQEKPEGAPFQYDTGTEAYRTAYIHKVYGLAFAITEEMMEDGDHISFAETYVRHLAHSMEESEELVHASVFNNASNSAVKGGDGQPLLSQAHPLADGGTASNMLSTPAQLSEAALEQLRTMVTLTPDERGKLINLRPDKLVVHPSQLFNATRILESTLRAGTANNDINALKALGIFPGGIVELSRLTDTEQFFVTTNAPNGLKHYDRAKVKRGSEGDFETGNMRYKVRKRYSRGWTDWRAVFGNK